MRRGNEIVKMSRRAGDYVALRDVLEEVGRDACRYFFLSRSANAHIDFDLDLAKKEIARKMQAVVVEGYTDVMACHLAGVGTAGAHRGPAVGGHPNKDPRRVAVGPKGFPGGGGVTLCGASGGE